ncbi:MAG: tRNA (adenosine(37)-N6)-threonylcarbamoyltransferase complex transferase subunit TsaD, partial [Clostridia bacterium]|nr:tRNA (adenosine(37)-N6)-threonylcarbamoyltransferase complex transferase subunit TsaD [Clostridia bacterium]
MAKILAIETSCDETAAAVVEDGRTVLSNIIFSQADMHARFGGVVPEIASRKHIEIIDKVVDEALQTSKNTFDDIDAIAVTSCPGLVGALLTGVSYAKALSYGRKLPLISVHHIKGHIAANYIEDKELKPPYLCLVVSGGHTQIVHVKDYLSFEILAKTRDDAIGEAFDKVARVLGLPYPGGVRVDKMAQNGNPDKITFTKPKLGDTDDFSFSGIKTAVNCYIKKILTKPVTEYADDEFLTEEGFEGLGLKVQKGGITKCDVAASFSKTVTKMLLDPFFKLAKEKGIKTVCMAGGVSANSFLRKEFFARGEKL